MSSKKFEGKLIKKDHGIQNKWTEYKILELNMEIECLDVWMFVKHYKAGSMQLVSKVTLAIFDFNRYLTV